MSTESVTLLEELRAQTRDCHRALDSSAFTRSLANGTLAPEGYRAMLKATFIIRATLERTLEAHASPIIASVWSTAFRRAPLLERDLQHLDRPGVREFSRAIQAASAVAELCRQRADRDPISLLGWLYVMEGSMKGAPVLCRLARRAFTFRGDEGLAYLSSADVAAAETWSDFSRCMNALALDDNERARVVEAAVELFDGLIEIFHALQPAADSLNPEAGRQRMAR